MTIVHYVTFNLILSNAKGHTGSNAVTVVRVETNKIV